jgi:hypothetical protein
MVDIDVVSRGVRGNSRKDYPEKFAINSDQAFHINIQMRIRHPAV